jgi:hypothetical protein
MRKSRQLLGLAERCDALDGLSADSGLVASLEPLRLGHDDLADLIGNEDALGKPHNVDNHSEE